MSDDYGNLFAFHSTTEKECEHYENNLHNIAKVIFYNTTKEKNILTSFSSTKKHSLSTHTTPLWRRHRIVCVLH